MDEAQIYIWTKYDENAEAHITGHREPRFVQEYNEEYLEKFIYFFADKEGNPPFEPRSDSTPDSEWMLEHKGEYLKTVGTMWYCGDDVCGCSNAEVYDVFTNKALSKGRVHKGVWEGVFTTDHDFRETEDSLIRYRQELKKTDPDFEARIEWQEGLDWDRKFDMEDPAVEAEIILLVNWLYGQDWGRVGGPLHVVLDDTNLEDRFFVEGSFMYNEIDRNLWPNATPQSEKDKAKCRRILDLLRPLSETQRANVLVKASQAPGPY